MRTYTHSAAQYQATPGPEKGGDEGSEDTAHIFFTAIYQAIYVNLLFIQRTYKLQFIKI